MDAPETVSQDAELLRTNLLDGDFARTDFLLNRINIYFSHNAEHRDRTGTDFVSAVGAGTTGAISYGYIRSIIIPEAF
jgi:hypothetical protein